MHDEMFTIPNYDSQMIVFPIIIHYEEHILKVKHYEKKKRHDKETLEEQ